MTERIDHVAKAYVCIDKMADAGSVEEYADADLAVKAAHVYATLALVEQQRIANLIAYVSRWTDDEVLDVDEYIREMLGFEARP